MRNQIQEQDGQRQRIMLDFTAAGQLPGALLRRLDEIAHERREEFNAMIAQLSAGLERDIDWWVTWPATRNTHVSRLFTRCIQLALVAEMDISRQPLAIMVDDPTFAALLISSGQKHVNLRATAAWKSALHNVASSLLNSASAWTAARLTTQKNAPSSFVFAVEEGINEGSFANNRESSHYYPGLPDLISDEDARALHVVPMFYRVQSYRKLLALIRNSAVPFLVREDYLSPTDYLFAMGHWWRTRHLLGRAAQFAGFAVGPLVDADIRVGRFTNAVFQSLLSYRFWRKLDGQSVHVTKLLDWYEGHDRDHATAAAINWHRLPIRHVAYRHLTGGQYLSAVPEQHEVDAGVVPHHFAVAGARAAQDLRDSVHGLDIHAVPSLRFARLARITRQTDTASPEILVLLGLEQTFQRIAQTMLALAFADSRLAHVRWILRPHPLTPPAMIDQTFGALAPHIQLSTRSFSEDISRAAIAMGAGTNALLEALVAGVPVITLAAGNEPTENPVPPWVPSAMADICYEADELPALILAQLASPAADAEHLRHAIVGDITMPGLREALG